MKQILLLTVLILFSIGCHHARIRLDDGSSNVSRGEVKTIHYTLWWGGLTHTWKIWSQFGNRKVEIDATAICPNGVYEIDDYWRWQDAVLAQITLNVYIPKTIKITCK